MNLERLPLQVKRLRAQVISDYMQRAGIARAVCFTCGNAGKALREAGVPVLVVGPGGSMQATEWLTPAQIAETFPGRFDATSGNLPLHLMVRIAAELQRPEHAIAEAIRPGGAYYVPTGSGETIVCLRAAFPAAWFIPYSDGTPATADAHRSPLWPLFGQVYLAQPPASAA